MATATKPRKARKLNQVNGTAQPHANGKAETNGQAPTEPTATQRLVGSLYRPTLQERSQGLKLIPLVRIVASPGNPRKRFDEEKHQELVDSIRQYGVLQPLIVQPVAETDDYEIVAGERRYRAATEAGMEAVPCIVRLLTDSEAREIALIENLQRQDIDPLEEALGFEQLLAGGDRTQEDLARRIGRSQAHVANRLRLLKLPKCWQQRLISGEITATQARELVPFADYAQAVKSIDEALKEWLRNKGWPYECFEDAVDDGLRQVSKTVLTQQGTPPYQYEQGLGHVRTFNPTDDERERLQCAEFDGETICFNVKLYDELQAKHVARLRDKQAKRTIKAKQQKPTTAEQKKLDQQKAKQFQRRLREIVADWYRYAIAEQIRDDVDDLVVLRLLLDYHDARAEDLDELLDTWQQSKRGPKRKQTARTWSARNWPQLAKLSQADTWIVARQFVAGFFWQRTELSDSEAGGKPVGTVDAEELPAIAEAVGVKLADWWSGDKLGPLTGRYWNAHSKEQLAELAVELGVSVTGSRKSDCVAALDAVDTLLLPAELATLKLDDDL